MASVDAIALIIGISTSKTAHSDAMTTPHANGFLLLKNIEMLQIVNGLNVTSTWNWRLALEQCVLRKHDVPMFNML